MQIVVQHQQYKTKNKVFLNQLHFQEVSCAVRQFARNTWLVVAHTERKATLLYMLPNLDRKGQSNSPSLPGKFPALPLKSQMIGISLFPNRLRVFRQMKTRSKSNTFSTVWDSRRQSGKSVPDFCNNWRSLKRADAPIYTVSVIALVSRQSSNYLTSTPESQITWGLQTTETNFWRSPNISAKSETVWNVWLILRPQLTIAGRVQEEVCKFSSLFDESRMSHYLHVSSKRQHILLSSLKTLILVLVKIYQLNHAIVSRLQGDEQFLSRQFLKFTCWWLSSLWRLSSCWRQSCGFYRYRNRYKRFQQNVKKHCDEV